jgi:hypothetical protein
MGSLEELYVMKSDATVFRLNVFAIDRIFPVNYA